jgi:hypothetical protein
MSKNLTANYSNGYVLAGTAASPLTVNAGVTVANTSGAAIGSALTSYVSVANNGTVTGSGGYGIHLAGPGGVANLGSIAGKGGVLTTGSLALYNAPGANIVGQKYGVGALKAAGSVDNAGVIHGSAYGGIYFGQGGVLTNQAGGTIGAGYYGVIIRAAAGSVSNGGTIVSSSQGRGGGVALTAGGTVANAAGAVIADGWIGVQDGYFVTHTITEAPALTVTNSGAISAADGKGDGAAVWLHGPGVVINEPGASIQAATNGMVVGGPLNGLANGGFGVVAYYQTTLINYGTVGGAAFSFDASNTASAFSNLIEMAPGATFQSEVLATNATASSTPLGTLILLSGASAGTVSGFGAKYVGFSAVALGTGADWSLGGTVASGRVIDFAGSHSGLLMLANPGSMQATVFGFGAGDTLALAGVSATGLSLSPSNTLTVEGAGVTLAFNPGQDFSATPFVYQVSGGETLLTVQCFAAGTRIATDRGPVAIEELAEGMRVVTARGGIAPVQWLGRRHVDCRRHPRPRDAWPVRIRAGAFGEGAPVRDLVLSPDHAVFIDQVLVPVRHLVNGTTIGQEQVDEVTYWHLELPAHDAVLAEGLPCESYLDTGNRAAFSCYTPPLDCEAPMRMAGRRRPPGW